MNREEIHLWCKGPVTEERIAELRYKLSKARGMLHQFLDNYELPDYKEVLQVLSETADP